MSIFIAGQLLIHPAVAKEDDREVKKINISKVVTRNKVNRSSTAFVEGYYYTKTLTVDIICYGAKETSIYIVDAAGDVAGYETFDFSVSPYFTMDAPVEKGTYWLVLDSAELYAEGNFVVE